MSPEAGPDTEKKWWGGEKSQTVPFTERTGGGKPSGWGKMLRTGEGEGTKLEPCNPGRPGKGYGTGSLKLRGDGLAGPEAFTTKA